MMNERLIVTAIGVALAMSTGISLAQQQTETMQQQPQTGGMTASGLAAMTAGDLEGKEIENADGNEIGEIEKIARGPDNQAYAIVAVGGFWGIGDRDVAIPLSDLLVQGDRVTLASGKSEDQLKQEAESRPLENYQTLDDDQSLAEYVGGAAGGTQMSFRQLDADGDGYITSQEASNSPALTGQWQNADRNSDGRVDQSEFSAFEMQME